MKKKKELLWIPLYVLVLLGILSLNVTAGLFIAPIAFIALLAAALSFVPRLRVLRFVGRGTAIFIVCVAMSGVVGQSNLLRPSSLARGGMNPP